MKKQTKKWKYAGTGMVLCVALTAVADEKAEPVDSPRQSSSFEGVPVSRAAESGQITRVTDAQVQSSARTFSARTGGEILDAEADRSIRRLSSTTTARSSSARNSTARNPEASLSSTKQLRLSWNFKTTQAAASGRTLVAATTPIGSATLSRAVNATATDAEAQGMIQPSELRVRQIQP